VQSSGGFEKSEADFCLLLQQIPVTEMLLGCLGQYPVLGRSCPGMEEANGTNLTTVCVCTAASAASPAYRSSLQWVKDTVFNEMKGPFHRLKQIYLFLTPLKSWVSTFFASIGRFQCAGG